MFGVTHGHGSQDQRERHANRTTSSQEGGRRAEKIEQNGPKNRPRSYKTLAEHRENLIGKLRYNKNPVFYHSVLLMSTNPQAQMAGKKCQVEAKQVFSSMRTWPTVGVDGRAEFPNNKNKPNKPFRKEIRPFHPKQVAIAKAYVTMRPKLLAMEKQLVELNPASMQHPAVEPIPAGAVKHPVVAHISGAMQHPVLDPFRLAMQKKAFKPVPISLQEPAKEQGEELIRIPLKAHRSMLLQYTLEPSHLNPKQYCNVLLRSEFPRLRDDGRYWLRKERSRQHVDVVDNIEDLAEAVFHYEFCWPIDSWKVRFRPMAVRKAFRSSIRPVLSPIAEKNDEDEVTCGEGFDEPVQGSLQEHVMEDGSLTQSTPEHFFPVVTIIQCGSRSGSDTEDDKDEDLEIVGGIVKTRVNKHCKESLNNVSLDAIEILESAPKCSDKMSTWKRLKRIFTCCLPSRKTR